MAGTAKTENTENAGNRRRSRTAGARLLLVVAVAFVALLAIAAAAACLPDLAAIVTEDASLEAGPVTHFQGCGDGIIATLDDGGDAGESCDPGPDGGVPGCTADCRIECDGGTIDPMSGHCYFAAGSDTSYESATTRCKLARGHLVTFASREEARFVDVQVAADAGMAATYWVGLLRSGATSGAYAANDPDQPGFPFPPKGPCSGCFGIGDDAGIFPAEVDAAAGPTLTECIASSGAWVQVPCTMTTARTTICEREPVGVRAQDCIGGFCFTVASTAGRKRYLVAVAMTDPDTAAQSCSGFDGGSLVVLESREEREQLAHEISARYPEDDEPVWIGLAEDGGAWTWDDGVVAAADAGRPLPWGNAQPDTAAPGARAYMNVATRTKPYDTQLSYADDARTPRFYICQRRPE